MSVRFALCLASASLLSVVALPAQARRPQVAPRPRIVNGTFTSGFPSVGALLAGTNAATADNECTGTMIGCQTFLTAAHCVCDGDGTDCQAGGPSEPDPNRFFVFLQHAGVFAVSNIALRSDYNFPVADVAVLTLAGPVTAIRPTPLNLAGTPATGASGTIVGFGRQGNGLYDYGLKRTGQVSLAPCSGGVSGTTSVCWNYDTPVGPAGTDSNTCNGDSGGPLFIDHGCGPVIAGITSGGTNDECVPIDASYDANVYYYRTFIQSAGGADLNNTTCGTMPQVGDAGTTVDSATGSLNSGLVDAVHQFTVAPGTDALRIAMNAIDDGSNYDLYVRFGSAPTTALYDCRDNKSNTVGYCAFSAPAAGTWYVLVHRITGSGPYQVTATTIAPGSPGTGTDGQSCTDNQQCSDSGVCSSGQCVITPTADGTPCSDDSACTSSDQCLAGACVGTDTPLQSCDVVPTRKANLSIRDSSGTKDSLKWNWTRGSASVGTFGNPTLATPYELCIFDRSGGTPVRRFDQTIAPGALWSASSTGYKLRDAAGSQQGLTSVRLRAGSGTAKIQVKARGGNLTVPSLPLVQNPNVTVQLTNGTHCWESTFSTHTRNQLDQFKATSD